MAQEHDDRRAAAAADAHRQERRLRHPHGLRQAHTLVLSLARLDRAELRELRQRAAVRRGGAARVPRHGVCLHLRHRLRPQHLERQPAAQRAARAGLARPGERQTGSAQHVLQPWGRHVLLGLDQLRLPREWRRRRRGHLPRPRPAAPPALRRPGDQEVLSPRRLLGHGPARGGALFRRAHLRQLHQRGPLDVQARPDQVVRVRLALRRPDQLLRPHARLPPTPRATQHGRRARVRAQARRVCRLLRHGILRAQHPELVRHLRAAHLRQAHQVPADQHPRVRAHAHLHAH
mmetsp:Transcript_1293/g.3102  ORF Transcript_1293/g.3102 Transcript_1293/m.3102 type:complete len:290 (+) Transcript_1293:1126-1995(+)